MFTLTVHSLINMNQQVIFHLNNGNDIIKNEYPLTIINGLFENVDEQLCKYYNIDYKQVNTIELISWKKLTTRQDQSSIKRNTIKS